MTQLVYGKAIARSSFTYLAGNLLLTLNPRISQAGKQIAFRPMSGANPEEPLWQKPDRRFRPSGRIFHEKCGLGRLAGPPTRRYALPRRR